MSKALFTPEELAELAAYDAMVDAEDISDEEYRESRRRDRQAILDRLPNDKLRRAQCQAEYYARNKEQLEQQAF